MDILHMRSYFETKNTTVWLIWYSLMSSWFFMVEKVCMQFKYWIDQKSIVKINELWLERLKYGKLLS